MKLQTFKIKDGVTLNYLKTDKFKTTNLSFFINRPLTEEEVTINALLSLVLKRSCPKYKTSMELNNALNDLYGAVIDTGIKKKGANQFLVTSFSFVNEKFIPGNPSIIDEIFTIAKDLLLNRNSFNEEYVSQEKENLKSLILSQKNDKRLYAQARLIEEMCKGEPSGIMRYGYVDKIDEITCEQLYTHYKDTVLLSRVDVFICGDVDIDRVLSLVKDMYKDITVKNTGYVDLSVKTDVAEVKDITETEEIAQGKLSIGFRTGITLKDKEYPALMMYNAILGSGIFSKLFNNVREKLSLCYYASSSVDSISGTMYINSGIEVSNFKKAFDEILKQVQDMKDGVISTEEFIAAKLGTINSIKSITDSAFGTIDYYLSKFVSGKMIDTDSLIGLIDKVTVDDIVKVAQGIKLDTVFFLKGSEK